MSNEQSIFYDIAGLLSQRCIFNFVIGNRGGGKTFGSKKLVINRFKKSKHQFVWVRRYQTEIDTLYCRARGGYCVYGTIQKTLV